MFTLALDPGLKVTGWAIFEGGALEMCGCLNTTGGDYASKTEKLMWKGSDYACDLNKLINGWELDAIIFEASIGYKSSAALRNMVMAYGVTIALAEASRTDWHIVTPSDVKKLTGSHKASKDEVKQFVRIAYPQLLGDLEYDIYDAVGVYLAWTQREKELKQ